MTHVETDDAISAISYQRAAFGYLEAVVRSELHKIVESGEIIAEKIHAGGILHTFGTGHSRIPALELCARAGGLAPVGMVSLKDLVMFGGVSPAQILDPAFERNPDLGTQVFELAPIDDDDIVLIISNSGANASVVEFALRAKERGLPIVAITSMEHTSRVISGHQNGQKLFELADIAIDNKAPAGDAILTLPSGQCMGGISSLTGVLIVQMIQAEITKCLLRKEGCVPILTSQNLPGGDQANAALLAQVGQKVRPIEP